MNPTIRVLSVRVPRPVAGQRSYRLALAFSDGTKGIADMASFVRRAPFLPLKDRLMFSRARVEHGAVEWPCDVGIASEALYALAHGLRVPITGAQVLTNELVVTLRGLRELAGRPQTDVAAELGISQSAISRFEHEGDHRVSTLRKFVQAVGAEIEIVAVLGNRRVVLRGI